MKFQLLHTPLRNNEILSQDNTKLGTEVCLAVQNKSYKKVCIDQTKTSNINIKIKLFELKC